MNRRNFVRLVGGGTAAAWLAGCSTEPPAAAIAAWQGPAADAHADVRSWALAHAILAPSSHNLQPWLLDLREADAVTLYVDRERLLPETDPWHRQTVVSQGTFIEGLVLALKARGVEPLVDLFPQGEFAARSMDERPVARVRWQPQALAVMPDPLFAQILRRRTAKLAYAVDRPVAAAQLAALLQVLPVGVPTHVQVAASADGEQVAALRRLCVDAARVEASTARTMMESNRLTRVGPAEIERHRDGVTLNGWMPRLAVTLGMYDRSQAPAPGSSSFKQVMQRYEDHANTAAAFVWISSEAPPGAGRSAEVWAGRSFMRLQLQATSLGLQVHPLSQAPQEFAEMRPHYETLHRLLAGGAGSGRTVQMLCRVGFCAPQAPTPRRPLESLLMA